MNVGNLADAVFDGPPGVLEVADIFLSEVPSRLTPLPNTHAIRCMLRYGAPSPHSRLLPLAPNLVSRLMQWSKEIRDKV
jgi:hypothetical protein